jgi:lactoylglutathione lyase
MIGRGLLRLFSEKPFKVLGVQQIALGHLDKNVLTTFWSDLLGIPKVGNYRSEK